MIIKNASQSTMGEGYFNALYEHNDLELNSLHGKVCKKATKKNVIAQSTAWHEVSISYITPYTFVDSI